MAGGRQAAGRRAGRQNGRRQTQVSRRRNPGGRQDPAGRPNLAGRQAGRRQSRQVQCRRCSSAGRQNSGTVAETVHPGRQ